MLQPELLAAADWLALGEASGDWLLLPVREGRPGEAEPRLEALLLSLGLTEELAHREGELLLLLLALCAAEALPPSCVQLA